jgi:hypothetical protein
MQIINKKNNTSKKQLFELGQKKLAKNRYSCVQ